MAGPWIRQQPVWGVRLALAPRAAFATLHAAESPRLDPFGQTASALGICVACAPASAPTRSSLGTWASANLGPVLSQDLHSAWGWPVSLPSTCQVALLGDGTALLS